ncbi:MAG: protein kinase [Candidatus Brocadiae bacterium]|nr:protein kinase [Candidatus Brocadiia bacterium]
MGQNDSTIQKKEPSEKEIPVSLEMAAADFSLGKALVCDFPEKGNEIPYSLPYSIQSVSVETEQESSSPIEIEYQASNQEIIVDTSISLSSLLEDKKEAIQEEEVVSLYLPEEEEVDEKAQSIMSQQGEGPLDIPAEDDSVAYTIDISQEENPLHQEQNSSYTMNIPEEPKEYASYNTMDIPIEEDIASQKTMDIPLHESMSSLKDMQSQTIEVSEEMENISRNITAVNMTSEDYSQATLLDPQIESVPQTDITIVDENLSSGQTKIETIPETDITIIDPEIIPQDSTANISKLKTAEQEKQPKPSRENAPKTKDGASIEGTKFKIGDVINNKYKIVQFLGKGGMGAVFKVEHLLLPSKKVFALKLMHAHLSKDNRFRMRFIREVEMAMEFTHEHAVQIRDFGETQDGSQYLTMDFSPGKALNEIIQKEGPLSMQRALSITRQILLALKTAHSKGIGHRDLKPDNILIEDRGGKEHALVLDFGIAKILTETKEDQKLTQKATIGTPLYMSPEQASGEEVDMRTDIYSMGIILYQMVTKQLPFTGSTRDVLLGHIVKPPPTPKTVRPDLDIPNALEELILKALEKERSKRYSSAEEFIQAIEKVEAPEVKEEAVVEVVKKKRSFFLPFSFAALIFLALCAYFVYFQMEKQKGYEKEFQTALSSFQIKEAKESLEKMQELFSIVWINQAIPMVYPEKKSYEKLQKSIELALQSDSIPENFIVQFPALLENFALMNPDVENIQKKYKNLKTSKALEEIGKKNLETGNSEKAIAQFESAIKLKKSSSLQKLLEIAQETQQGIKAWENQEWDNAFNILIGCKNKAQNLGITIDFPALKELERKESIKLFCKVLKESLEQKAFDDIKDKSIQDEKAKLDPLSQEEKSLVDDLYQSYEDGRKRFLNIENLLQLVQEGLSQKDFSDTKENFIQNRKQQLEPLSEEEKQKFALLYEEYRKEKRNANILQLSKYIEDATKQGDFSEATQNSIKIRRTQLEPFSNDEKQAILLVYRRYLQEKSNSTKEQTSKVRSKLSDTVQAGIQQYRLNQIYEAQRTLEEYFSSNGEQVLPEQSRNAAEYLGLTYYKNRNWLNAIKYFEKASSSNPEAIAYYGLALFQQSQDRKALDYINRALDLSHEMNIKRELYESKITILTRSFSYDEQQLLDALKKYFEIQPNPSLDYIKKLGSLYLKFNNKAQALPLLVQYLDRTDWQDKSIVNTWLSLQNFHPLAFGNRWEYRVASTGSIIHYTVTGSTGNRFSVSDNTGQVEEWYVESGYLYKEGRKRTLVMPVPLSWISWQRDNFTVDILSVNEVIRLLDKDGKLREFSCVVFKVSSISTPGNFTKEYYAAGVGEVKVERYRNDQKIFQRELVSYIVR